MILPYLLRLVCLCFASFFLIHTVFGLATWCATPVTIRLVGSMRPRLAAGLLFALRLLPVALASVLVLGLCLPSYLWLEPKTAAERVGFACCVSALLGAAVWGASIARVLRSAAVSHGYARRCQQVGRETRVPGVPSPVLVLDDEAPLLALAGVVCPRIVISRGVLRALSPKQLEAALRHEQAHRTSRDNLRRLLLLLIPDVFPFFRIHATLEGYWGRLTEWAADDRAIEGDSLRPLSLATALVRVARMGATARLPELVASLVARDHDLSARVERLLRAVPAREERPGRVRALLGGVALVTVISLAAAMLRPNTLYSVHRLLERLVR